MKIDQYDLPALFALLGLVLIAVVSYVMLSDILSAGSLREWCTRSFAYPLAGFLFLWAVFDLLGVWLGAPLGAHGPSRPNAMNRFGFGGGSIVRFVASSFGFGYALLKQREKLDLWVTLLFFLSFMGMSRFFFAGGLAYPLGSIPLIIDTALNRLNMWGLNSLGFEATVVSTWRGLLLGFVGVSLLPYVFLLRNHVRLKTLLLLSSLSLWARMNTRICDPRTGPASVALKYLPNLEVALILASPLWLLVLLVVLGRMFYGSWEPRRKDG